MQIFKMSCPICILILSGFVMALVHCEEEYVFKDAKLYRFDVDDQNTVDFLNTLRQNPELDVWDKGLKIGATTSVRVPKTKQAYIESFIRNRSLKYEVLNAQVVGDNERKVNRAVKPKKLHLGISFEKYHRYGEINSYLEKLASLYSNFTKLITIGSSYEGRDLKVLHISTGGKKNKPAIFIDGGIHAREWISPATVLYIIHELVEKSSENRGLIKDVDYYFLPVVNVDGYEYTHTNERFWRKTRRPVPGSRCSGADPNRNFDFQWRGPGTSTNPCSEIYIGTKPFSENVTQAVRDFGMEIKDNLKLYITFHSYGNYIAYPWSYTMDLPDNAEELQSLGDMVNKALDNQYTVGSIAHIMSFGAGGSDDWFKAVPKTDLVYCFELPGEGHGFDLPPHRIAPVVKHVFKGIKVFGSYVKEKYV